MQNPKADIEKYVEYLVQEEGFSFYSSEDNCDPSLLRKESVTPQNDIFVYIQFSYIPNKPSIPNGYTITISKSNR